jgi:hypothetical protein
MQVVVVVIVEVQVNSSKTRSVPVVRRTKWVELESTGSVGNEREELRVGVWETSQRSSERQRTTAGRVEVAQCECGDRGPEVVLVWKSLSDSVRSEFSLSGS